MRAGRRVPRRRVLDARAGTPGGDYGEEAHWQRFIDAYAAQIRSDPACAPLTDPAGPCAATIAHLMGAAAHGMGDEVWDWLFEPNGPGLRRVVPAERPRGRSSAPAASRSSSTSSRSRGTRRPVGPTPPIPDAAKIDAAFASVGRGDIDPARVRRRRAASSSVERGAEAVWAPLHIDALERAMPWTSAHLIDAAGGVDFGADAIAGYYETLWGDLLGDVPPTRVSLRRRPSTGR